MYQAEFALHMRPNFLYSLSLQICDEIPQPKQVFHSSHCPPRGKHDEGIRFTNIRPTGRKVGQFHVGDVIKHPPFIPTEPTIDELELASDPRMKWVGHPEQFSAFVPVGCSSEPRANFMSSIRTKPGMAGFSSLTIAVTKGRP